MPSPPITTDSSPQPLPIALIIITIYWLLDCAMDAWIFGDESFLEQITEPSTQEVAIRVLASTVLLISAFWVRHVLGKGQKQKEALATALQTTEKQRQDVVVLNKELTQRTEELTVSNDELASFAHALNHELRNPLTQLFLAVQSLEKKETTLDDDTRYALEAISEAGGSMSAAIDAMLILSGVSRRKMEKVEIDLSLMVREIADEFAQKDPERKCHWAIAPHLLTRGDPLLLRLALLNLISNAWKYTDPELEAMFAFGAARRGDLLTYYLRDNGCGFSVKEGSKIFEPFQRLAHPREVQGTGIGLATVRRIISRHGGHIWAESRPGRGATFFFTLYGGTPTIGAKTGS
ncbi:MAG: histidine kinase [Desulfuromonas sp.]|nr:MAG: histidine kinase [Desulfuromonas sp.]